MWEKSQILTIAGLIFEFISVFLTARQAFYSKRKRIEKTGRTFRQQIREERIEGILTLMFLIIGITLQGIAVFV